jgi:hypothetical protein
MTTYAITTTQNITDLTAKTGGDTYNINGGTLIIDTDTRWAKNASTTSVIGAVNVSATLGGSFVIDAQGVRVVRFDSGTGLVPAGGTTITQGATSCELMCVMSDYTGGTVYAAGTALPSSGWLKVKGLTAGITAATAFTSGISAQASSVDQAGWIIVVGQDLGTFNIPRLGSMTVSGTWFEVGLTNGTRGQTIQLPFFTAETGIWYPGVEVETSVGSGVYEFWPNAGARFTSVNCSSDTRARFVTISTTGIVKFGEGFDASLCGDLPVAGCRVRIPNIITQNAAAATRTVNSEPSRTAGNRFEAVFTSAGQLTLSCCTGAWYWNIAQAYSLSLDNLHTCDQVLVQEIATPVSINGLHSGLSTSSTSFASNALVFQQNYNGGTVTNMSWLRSDMGATSAYSAQLVNLYGNWYFENLRGGALGVAAGVAGALFVNTCDDVTINGLKTFTKRVLISACNRVSVNNFEYADNVVGTTPTTIANRAIEILGQSADVSVTDIKNWVGAVNVHPYMGWVMCNTAKRVKVRFCGTPANPLNCGTVNLTGYLFDDAGNNDDIKFQRCWTTGLRSGLFSGTNTTFRFIGESCYTTDASKTVGPQQLYSKVHGNRFNGGGVPSSFIGVYGTTMWDGFTGDTTARAALIFCESINGEYQILSGTPAFTAQGALAMRTLGDQIQATWPWYIKGWTGLTSMALTGVNTTNHTVEYDLDKGAGFSGTFKVLSNANLALETGIDPVIGFKPRIRITTTVSNTTNRLDSLRFDGTTTLELQNTAFYPLDQATVTVTGLPIGTQVAVFAGVPTEGALPAATGLSTSSSITLTYDYDGGAIPNYTIRIRKAGYIPIELQYANTLQTTIPVSPLLNADGYGVPIYGRGSGATSAFVSVDGPALRIDIGNQLVLAEDLYDVISTWQATTTGITYSEALRFDGRDCLLLGSWRLRRGLPAYTNAGVDSSVVVNGMATASPDDELNGSVDIRAKAVRTYQLNAAPSLTATDIAQAVWNYTLSTGNTSESELLTAKVAAQNAFAVSA